MKKLRRTTAANSPGSKHARASALGDVLVGYTYYNVDGIFWQGMDWYWNEHFKIYMFWLHGDFGDPVVARPGGFQKSADMFWLRCQLWF